MQNNTIKLDGNGNLLLQDSTNNIIIINTNDQNVLEKINELNNEQIAVIQKIVIEQAERFSDLFKILITGVASQKNVVQGNINATSVRIGDEIHYHYYPQTKLPKELTGKIPLLETGKIIGRTSDLEELHKMLFSNKQVVVMNGLGGIGKTTLAQVYASKYWDLYKHVAWITQTSDDICLDFVNEQVLASNLSVNKTLSDPKDIFNEVMRKLKAVDQEPNLLIIDNADSTLEKVRDSLPKQPLWHILITSRQELNGFTLKTIDFLNPEDALGLFNMHYTRNDLYKAEIEELNKSVDYHTLTIEILAKTGMVQRYSFEELKDAITNDARAQVSITRPDTDKIERITSYLCSIFNMSKLTENELWMLKQFVCLPTEFHAFKLVKELIIEEKSEKEEIFAETIEELSVKGWLLKSKDTDSFKMHRIICEVIKRKTPFGFDDIVFLIDTITDELRLNDFKSNPEETFQWIPFGNALLKTLDIQKDTTTDQENKIATLQNNLALALQNLGDYEGAKKLLEKAVKSAENNFGIKHPLTAIYYSHLALVLQDLGDYEGAKKLLKKAVQIDEKNFGTEHPSTALSYSYLAGVHQDLGDYEEAKKLLEKALKSTEKNFGVENISTARSYSNLALVLQDLGDYEGAKKLLEKALKSTEKNLGTEHPLTAICYSNLATVYKNIGDYKRAKKLLEKAVKSDESNFGTEHPTTAVSYSNLAIILKALGDYEGAKKIMEKAAKSIENNFGVEHSLTAISYQNLATVLQKLGDYNGALELSDKALVVFIKVFPKGHPYIDLVKKNIEIIKQQMK